MSETPKEFGPPDPEARMAEWSEPDDSELSDSDHESDPELSETQPSIAELPESDRQIRKSGHPDSDGEEEYDESKVFKSEPDYDVTDDNDDVINDDEAEISRENYSGDIQSSSTNIKVRI